MYWYGKNHSLLCERYQVKNSEYKDILIFYEKYMINILKEGLSPQAYSRWSLQKYSILQYHFSPLSWVIHNSTRYFSHLIKILHPTTPVFTVCDFSQNPS